MLPHKLSYKFLLLCFLLYSPFSMAVDQYIFGYGSLMNIESRNASDPNLKSPNIPVTAHIQYVRAWNFKASFKWSSSGFTALGLKDIKPAIHKITGVIYKVGTDEKDMAAFDKREKGYKRVNISQAKIDFYYAEQKSLVSPDRQIWVYVPEEQSHKPTKEYPLLQSYIDVCMTGALELTPGQQDFVKAFVTGTAGWDTEYWLNDRLLARRPWVYQKQYKAVDDVLGHKLKNRKFSEEYAAFFNN